MIWQTDVASNLITTAFEGVRGNPAAAAELANFLSVGETVTLLRSWGVALANIAAGGKRPRRTGWTLRSSEAADFGPDDQVGIMCGTLSEGLVCIDVDGPLALSLADAHLPQTQCVEGRPGKPGSHRYYYVTDVAPEWQSTAAGGIGGPPVFHYRVAKIDLIGTGGHVVGPPSVHPSGERRRWELFGPPTTICFSQLLGAVNALAVACGDRARERRIPGVRTGGGNAGRPAVDAGAGEHRYRANLPPMGERVARARRYVSQIEAAVSGEGGSDATFRVAALLLRDFGLDMDSARALMMEYNARCLPEWSLAELEHKLADADRFTGLRGTKLTRASGRRMDTVSLADRFLSGLPTPIRWYRGSWYAYIGTQYQRRDDGEFEAMLSAFLTRELGSRSSGGRTRREVCRQLIRDVAAVLEGGCVVPSLFETPCALPSGERPMFFSCANGLVDVGAMLAGRPNGLHAHTPNWFSTTSVDYRFDPTAQCPMWHRVLDRALRGDADAIALIQEWFGYCVVPNTDLQQLLLLVGGGGANGKSTIAAALTAMLGPANVSHVGLEDFANPFRKAAMLGKLANVGADIGEIDKVSEGRLKAAVSGDREMFERKYKDPTENIPTARLLFCANVLPRFSDRSDGIWRRLLLLPFPHSIPRSEQVAGLDKPDWWLRSGELPGILSWALDGLVRLHRTGRFTRPASMERAIADYRLDVNPARQFVVGHCRRGAGAITPKQEVYQGYSDWCRQHGHTRPMAANSFGRELAAALGGEIETQKVQQGTRRVDGYAGVRYYPGGVPDAPPPGEPPVTGVPPG